MNKTTVYRIIFCLALQIIAVPATAINSPLADKSLFSQGYPELAPTSHQRLTFEQLNSSNILLRGIRSTADINFMNRVDHIVTALKLKFSYAYSPALLPGLSHIKVYLNDEIMATIPIKESDQIASKGLLHQELSLNPRLIRDFNTLRFELIGHYSMGCEDPFHSSIWTDISRSSHIELERQQLPLDSKLALLPEPFFDRRDHSKLVVPFIFSRSQDQTTVESAAVLSSWFGALADWRGAEFPVIINKLSNRHSVVFATNDNKPDFLLDYPDVQGPTVEVIANPVNRYQKMLLILGRNSQDLKIAVEGLTLGLPMMTGRTAQIDQIEYLKPRQAYDAPRWLRSDRAVTFGELIGSSQQLQVSGYNAPAVRMDVRMPPDLFTWHRRGIPIDLKYRYSPPARRGDSRLNMSINDKFVQGYNLGAGQGDGSVIENIRIPLLSTDDTDKQRYFSVPGFKVDVKNELAFQFIFSTEREGLCTTTPAEGMKAVIDEGSTIDISQYSHYITMPDLNAFAKGGFPYSKYADLSESLLLLPAIPSAAELATLLSATAHIGSITGYPAIKAEVKFANNNIEFENKDILIIGNSHNLVRDAAELTGPLTALVEASDRILKQAIYETKPQQYSRSAADATSRVTIKSAGPLAVIAGFQSPFSEKRSVIAMMASAPEHYSLLTGALSEGGKLDQINGSATILTEHGIYPSYVGERYYVGNLPVYQLIWFHLADHPIMLAILTVLTLLLLSFLLWRILTSLAVKRLAKHEEE